MRKSTILAAVTVSLLAAPASAQLVALDSGDFGGADTVISFTGVPNEAPVGATFAGDGVTFSGSLFGLTNDGDIENFPDNGEGVIASNWIYDGPPNLQGLSFEAVFASPVSRVGFFLENWPAQTFSAELFDGANSLGTFAFASTTSLDAEFRGVGSTSAFDRAVFTNTMDNNGFFAIDDFVFGGGLSAPVPEPSTWALMLVGFAGLGYSMRRRNKTSTSVTYA